MANKRNNQKKFRMEQSRRPKKNPLKAEGIEKVDYLSLIHISEPTRPY